MTLAGRGREWPVWKRITLRRWVIMNLILIGLVIVWTPALPVPVTAMERAAYNTVQATPKESVVLWGLAHPNPDTYYNARDAFVIFLTSLAQRNFKIIFTCFGPISPTSAEDMARRADLEGKFGYKYGQDYVIFPFLTGEEVAMAAVAADFAKAYSTDNRGNPTLSLPLMQRVHSMKDVQLAISYYSVNTFAEMFLRQWPVKYGVPYIAQGGLVEAYFGKYVQGIGGISAAYESLVGIPGEELIKLQAGNVANLLTLSMILISVIKFQADRTKRQPATVEGSVKE